MNFFLKFTFIRNSDSIEYMSIASPIRHPIRVHAQKRVIGNEIAIF